MTEDLHRKRTAGMAVLRWLYCGVARRCSFTSGAWTKARRDTPHCCTKTAFRAM